MSDRPYEDGEPIIRDKRRIDPRTGELREPGVPGSPAAGAAPAPGAAPGGTPTAPTASAAPDPGAGADGALAQQLAERTADLQRISAEYANYRRRVERDRLAVAEQALASVLVGLLPVLDDIGRAREHGELEGGFKSVAEALETTLTKLGLASYGEPGEPFDPTVHDALMHSLSADVDVPTAVQILQPGYRLGERVLRPARVAVAEPEHPVDIEPPAADEGGDDGEITDQDET